MTDLALLQRFEPVVRYTAGEMFYPCAVDGYLAQCSLWQRDREGQETPILPPGSLNAQTLATVDPPQPGAELFLRYVDKPLDPLAFQRWLNSPAHPPFSSVGRLARVGMIGRTAEALFNFSLLIRGRVPGGTTAQAQQQYAQMHATDPRYVYYGRVLRDENYVILHYYFFYVMNDWRSSFHGVNDHESDWEQIYIYLSEETEGDFTPHWVAFAAHDFSGDDLRRRWDDPELEKVGENHVVVYAGAGSHAAYVQPGEYLMQVEPQAIKPVKAVIGPLRQALAEAFSGDEPAPDVTDAPLFPLAFVDYARGDGLAIGPQQPQGWSPELLSDDLPWVSSYRGLWGLDTGDPLGGERAPAGPKFDRDGSVRYSWQDPLGWSGLDKVPAPQMVQSELQRAIEALDLEAGELWALIEQRRAALRAQGLAAQALADTADLQRQTDEQTKALAAAEKELQELTAGRTAVVERRRALQNYLARLQHGDLGDPQAHLKHKTVPQPPAPPIARALDLWAAISGALLMIILIMLVTFLPPQWPLWIVVTILTFGVIEATLRGRAVPYLLTSTVVLAAISAAVLIYDYWRWLLPGALLAVFLYSLLTNLRELRTRRPHR